MDERTIIPGTGPVANGNQVLMVSASSPDMGGKQKDGVKLEGGCYFPHRYILFVLVMTMMAVVFAMRTSFNLALVAMVNMTSSVNTSDECPISEPDNASVTNSNGEFNWDPTTQGHALASFYYCYILMQIPGGYISERFGAKKLIFICVFLPGLIYTFIPYLARWSVYALIVGQATSGFFSGALFPSLYALWAQWAPESERTILVSNSLSGLIIGQLAALGLTGFICDSDLFGGWPSVFYIFGTACCIWSLFWLVFAHDTPASDPSIAEKELKYIQAGTQHLHRTDYRTPPYLEIFKSVPMWAAVVASLTHSFWFYVMFATMPIYMQQILRFRITENGIVSMLPIGAAAVGCTLFPILADVLRAKRILSTTATRKLATAIGMIVMGAVFVLVPLTRCHQVAAVSLMVFVSVLSGASTAGFYVSANDIAPQYAGTLVGISNMAGNLSGFIAPLVVEAVTGLSPSITRWTHMFYVTSALLVFGGIFFVIFGSGDVQDWAKPGFREDEDVQVKLDARQGRHLPEAGQLLPAVTNTTDPTV